MNAYIFNKRWKFDVWKFQGSWWQFVFIFLDWASAVDSMLFEDFRACNVFQKCAWVFICAVKRNFISKILNMFAECFKLDNNLVSSVFRVMFQTHKENKKQV